MLVARDTVVQDSSSRHRPWRQTGKQAIIHNCTIMRLEMILRILGGGVFVPDQLLVQAFQRWYWFSRDWKD